MLTKLLKHGKKVQSRVVKTHEEKFVERLMTRNEIEAEIANVKAMRIISCGKHTRANGELLMNIVQEDSFNNVVRIAYENGAFNGNEAICIEIIA